MTIKSIPNAIILAWGLKRMMWAFGAGALGALAMPPFGVFAALMVSFPVLMWLIDGAAAGRRGLWSAAVVGWWFGFGYHLAGLWWIGSAFLVEADRFAWALPFAVTALPAGLAVFTALGCVLARLLWAPGGWRIIALAVGLTAAEFARGTLFTGFPWNLYGYALTQMNWTAQGASLVGAYGMTLLAVLVFAAPAMLFDEGGSRRARLVAPVLALVAAFGLAGWGFYRVRHTAIERVEGVKLRIVQPNVPQDQRFNADARDWVMKRYKDLSDRATSAERSGMSDVTHLIWPESAFPFFLAWDGPALAEIGELLSSGATLITGAARPEHRAPSQDPGAIFNSVYVIGRDGAIAATYDKSHLVPFGEYLPLSGLFSRLGLTQIIDVPGGFSSASRRRRLNVPGAPSVQPLICYEVIFPGQVSSDDGRAGWIVNVTNDAWFGQTPGPYQHLHQTQVRAIEEGLPIVRAANSGISAIIDPLGRSMRTLALGEAGVLDGELPKALAPTVFSQFRHWPAILGWLLLASACVWQSRRRRAVS